MMTIKSICFTGHRKIPAATYEKILPELRRVLQTAVAAGYLDFYAGGALGWDTICALEVLELRRTNPEVALHLVLPCSPEEQTAKWNPQQRQLFDAILKQANSCEFVSESYTKDCMRKRNQRLVDLADCCISHCRDFNGRTGTAQTVRMAKRKGIPVLNLLEPLFDERSST